MLCHCHFVSRCKASRSLCRGGKSDFTLDEVRDFRGSSDRAGVNSTATVKRRPVVTCGLSMVLKPFQQCCCVGPVAALPILFSMTAVEALSFLLFPLQRDLVAYSFR